MVDGSNPIFSFYSLNWGSIQFFFLSKIDICLLSLVSCLRRSCSLVFSGGWSKKPAKQGNEFKTKNLSHNNVTDKRTFPATRLRQTSTSSVLHNKDDTNFSSQKIMKNFHCTSVRSSELQSYTHRNKSILVFLDLFYTCNLWGYWKRKGTR